MFIIKAEFFFFGIEKHWSWLQDSDWSENQLDCSIVIWTSFWLGGPYWDKLCLRSVGAQCTKSLVTSQPNYSTISPARTHFSQVLTKSAHVFYFQKQALANGMYFFRCAFCNNYDEFQKEMRRMGIYIPDRWVM
jgi:hypothetical protein